jgi:hypothetical protein
MPARQQRTSELPANTIEPLNAMTRTARYMKQPQLGTALAETPTNAQGRTRAFEDRLPTAQVHKGREIAYAGCHLRK